MHIICWELTTPSVEKWRQLIDVLCEFFEETYVINIIKSMHNLRAFHGLETTMLTNSIVCHMSLTHWPLGSEGDKIFNFHEFWLSSSIIHWTRSWRHIRHILALPVHRVTDAIMIVADVLVPNEGAWPSATIMVTPLWLEWHAKLVTQHTYRMISYTGLILGLRPSNERRRY